MYDDGGVFRSGGGTVEVDETFIDEEPDIKKAKNAYS
jgi:hypothetical protein